MKTAEEIVAEIKLRIFTLDLKIKSLSEVQVFAKKELRGEIYTLIGILDYIEED